MTAGRRREGSRPRGAVREATVPQPNAKKGRNCVLLRLYKGYEKDIFGEVPLGFELQRYAYDVILIQCDKLGDWFRKWL